MPRSVLPLCQGPRFTLNTGGSWAAGGYLGADPTDGSSTLAANIVPWVAPCPGYVRLMVVTSLSTTSGIVVKMYKATRSASPSYAATSLSAAITSGFGKSDAGFLVAEFDLVVAWCDSIWNANGVIVNSMFAPLRAA